MKIISDFDDVMFNNSKLKEIIIATLTKAGIPQDIGEQTYQKEKESGAFSLTKFLHSLVKDEAKISEMYEEIMGNCQDLVNMAVLDQVRSAGDNNVYIISEGDEAFQRDKISRSTGNIFPNITIVHGAKNRKVEEICRDFPKDDVIFVDDKQKYFDDIDMSMCPNLKTVLFTKYGLQMLKDEIESSVYNELNRKKH